MDRSSCERPLASAAEVEAALGRAADAQRRWAHVPVGDRAAACTRAVDWCVAHAAELGAELTSQMGRPIAHSPFEITRGFQERARYMADIAASALADIEVEQTQNFHKFIRRAPLGVVLVLAPWNYPWLTSVNAIVPALLAGNAVILKMALQTPLVAERYAEAFAAAGLPDGVFQYLHIDHDQVGRMIGDERIAFVAFTGSVAGGHAVQRAAADRFIGTGLELGGKDAAYVRADAAFDHAVENIVDGAFFNAGQSCCSVQRVYVDRRIHDRFVEAAVALTNTYVLGDPRDPATTHRTDGAEGRRRLGARSSRRGNPLGREGADRSRSLCGGETGHGLHGAGDSHERQPRHARDARGDIRARDGHHACRRGRRSGPPHQRQPLRSHLVRLDDGRGCRAATLATASRRERGT